MDCTYPQALKLAVVPRDVAQTSTYKAHLAYMVNVHKQTKGPPIFDDAEKYYERRYKALASILYVPGYY